MKVLRWALLILVAATTWGVAATGQALEGRSVSIRTKIQSPSAPEPADSAPNMSFATPNAAGSGVGPSQRIISTPTCNSSEIGIGASRNGRNIVVASNGDFVVSSQDGGANWSAQAAFPNGGGTTQGDPSVGIGRNGRAYLAYIWNNPAPSCDFGISVSTNQGLTFPAPVSAVTCAPSGPPTPGCFPDQEYIGVDQVNAGPTGGDQVYLSWRQFTNLGCPSAGVGNEDASITCSPNSGAAGTWVAPVLVDAAGDRPRPAVAPDGTVYVVYVLGDGGAVQVRRFTSCGNGLTTIGGINQVAPSSTVTGVPFLDRQGQEGNPVVGVDPFNSNLVYVVYGLNTSASTSGDPGIFLRISTNGGVNWGAAIQINDNVANNTSRYFPWLAVNPADGSVVIGWYDRRDDPANNNLTAYFGARVTGGGTPTVTVSPNFRISEVDYAASQPGVTCSSPIYGDYNWVAAGPEFMYAAWASPVSPPEIQPPSVSVDVFFAAIAVGEVPQIQPGGLLDYGNVCVGSNATKELTICNSGKTDLIINSVTSSDPEFAPVGVTFPLVISPDACFPVQVKFTPSSQGAKAATLTIASNDPVSPSVTVQATGTGGVAKISTVIADTGNYGDVCVGSFEDLNLTISNGGTCSLSVSGISSSSPDFQTPATNSFPLVIQAGTSLQVPIRFAATSGGAHSANITISSNDPTTPSKVVAVSGNAPPPIATTSGSLDFGQLCVGDSKTQTVQLCDTGKCNLVVTGAALVGANCADVTLVSPSPSSLPLTISPDSCFGFVVKFSPTSGAAPNCSLVINTNDPAHATVTLPITATVGAPHIVLDPTSLDGIHAFPATVVDPNGALACFSDRSVVVRNNGTCPLKISGIAATAPFRVIAPTQFPVILPPGEETLNVGVRFAPTTGGGSPTAPNETTGTLTVTSNDSPATEPVCGEATVQSGVRVLVVDGTDTPINGVDSLTLTSKGLHTPQPISIKLTNLPVATATVCGNAVTYHLDNETLPPTQTTGSNPNSSYIVSAKEKNKQINQSFTLGQCEFKQFILKLQ